MIQAQQEKLRSQKNPRDELNKALDVIFQSMPVTQVFLRHYGEDIKEF